MKRKLKLITLIPLCMTMTFQSFADGFAKQKEIITAKDVFGDDDDYYDDRVYITEDDFVEIPGMNIKMLKTEVTQKMFKSVTGENPSLYHEGYESESRPVENVSKYDAIYFCNKLSLMHGKEPVYTVNGKSDVEKWGYRLKFDSLYEDKIEQNLKANGYRLPTKDEWLYAAKGGEDFTYAGSNNIRDVGWCSLNCDRTRPVGKLKPNGYGLYDMTGNVCEWVNWWSEDCKPVYECISLGGCYDDDPVDMDAEREWGAGTRDSWVGFRIVYNTK